MDEKYDGIIVTHGTDTLPYSAAALSYALGNDCIPVCIVSSNYPISDERANGIDNLHGAIRLMESGYTTGETGNDDKDAGIHCGVFVSYRNHDGVIYIHRASRLLETAAFQPLRDAAVFNGVYIDYGITVWLNGEIDIAPEYLYKE